MGSKEFLSTFYQSDKTYDKRINVRKSFFRTNSNPNLSLDWTYGNSPIFQQKSYRTNMAAQLTIVEICELIREFNGDVNELNSYSRRIDTLWGYINNLGAENLEANRTRFMLILEQRLIGRAAVVLQDVEFTDWQTVKDALRARLTTNSIERIEAKILSTKQKADESLDFYASKMESFLDELNRSYDTNNDENNLLRRENDRKVRKSFEAGLFDPRLRERALIRSASSLRDSIDYFMGQEITLKVDNVHSQSFQGFPIREHSFCDLCYGAHETINCRRGRMSLGNERNNYNNNIRLFGTNNPLRFNNSNRNNQINYSNDKNNITCYICGDSHFANQCPHRSFGQNSYSRNNYSQNNSPQNNYQQNDYSQNNASSARNPVSCYTCGETTHLSNQCPERSTAVCYICSDPSHMANNCPQKITTRPPNLNFASNNNQQQRYNQNQPPMNNPNNSQGYSLTIIVTITTFNTPKI